MSSFKCGYFWWYLGTYLKFQLDCFFCGARCNQFDSICCNPWDSTSPGLGVPSKEAETLWSEMSEVGKAHGFEGKVPKDGIRDRCLDLFGWFFERIRSQGDDKSPFFITIWENLSIGIFSNKSKDAKLLYGEFSLLMPYPLLHIGTTTQLPWWLIMERFVDMWHRRKNIQRIVSWTITGKPTSMIYVLWLMVDTCYTEKAMYGKSLTTTTTTVFNQARIHSMHR